MLAILLVDHGSRRPEANRAMLEVAELVGRWAGPQVLVRHAHMEIASPSISDGFRSCIEAGAHEIVVHPYMLLPGRHSAEDLPRLVSEVAAAYPSITWRVSEPLGVHPGIAQVVLERCGLRGKDSGSS